MRLRIISDIHCDINTNDSFKYDFDDDIVICCGDISGDRFKTGKWIKNKIKQGICIAGNHLGYNWISAIQQFGGHGLPLMIWQGYSINLVRLLMSIF